MQPAAQQPYKQQPESDAKRAVQPAPDSQGSRQVLRDVPSLPRSELCSKLAATSVCTLHSSSSRQLCSPESLLLSRFVTLLMEVQVRFVTLLLLLTETCLYHGLRGSNHTLVRAISTHGRKMKEDHHLQHVQGRHREPKMSRTHCSRFVHPV